MTSRIHPEMPANMKKAMAYSEKKPASVCKCGCTGDGANSQHQDTVQAGHGACRNCPCPKFSWKEHLPEFEAYMASSN